MTGSTGPGAPYAPEPACSPTPRPGVSRPCSPMIAMPRSRPPGGVYQRPVPGLPHRGPGPGKVPDATAHRLPETDHPRRLGGDHNPDQDPDRKSHRHPWPTSTTPHLQQPHARPSTGAWSTYAASPWAYATSPATPSAASSTPDASKTTRQQPPKPDDKPHLPHPQTRRARLGWK